MSGCLTLYQTDQVLVQISLKVMNALVLLVFAGLNEQIKMHH